jgi:uncharacterized protein YcbX
MGLEASDLGAVAALWRYPVKSMQGEELDVAQVMERGLLGDRVYALVDSLDGKAVTAKNPRKWPRMFSFRAAFVSPARVGAPLPDVRITDPDGDVVTSSDVDASAALSKALGREVNLESVEQGASSPTATTSEEYWPDIEGLEHRETVTDFELPEGTFFDCAIVHLLTTATLDRFAELYPQGRFDVRRFRPNIVVASPSGTRGFVENDWVGRTIRLGGHVRLRVVEPCPRCVMATLAQDDLPKDSQILRTIARHNQVNAGVYAAVVTGGVVRREDPVILE